MKESFKTPEGRISQIVHDINNPVAYITNNLDTMTDYAKKMRRLLLQTRQLISVMEREKDALPNGIKGPLLQLKKLYEESDFDLIAKDAEKLVSESLEGCRQIIEKTQDLQKLFR